VDNAAFIEALRGGANGLEIELSPELEQSLLRHYLLMVQWNRRVNLTAVLDPAEAAERHFVDSLALLRELGTQPSLLDLGAGAGFPGLVIKQAAPHVQLQMVDAVAKKVAFLKQVVATLGLKDARAFHVRLDGHPEREGLARVACVTARAVGPLERLLPLVGSYLLPEGVFVAALGITSVDEVERSAQAQGWSVRNVRTYQLPVSRAARAVAVLVPPDVPRGTHVPTN
jgi:16S rRNA (guanine527-N7)-methyltransferase